MMQMMLVKRNSRFGCNDDNSKENEGNDTHDDADNIIIWWYIVVTVLNMFSLPFSAFPTNCCLLMSAAGEAVTNTDWPKHRQWRRVLCATYALLIVCSPAVRIHRRVLSKSKLQDRKTNEWAMYIYVMGPGIVKLCKIIESWINRIKCRVQSDIDVSNIH